MSSIRVGKKSHNARLCLRLWHDRWVNYSHVKLRCQRWRKMVMIHKFPQPQFTAHYRVFIECIRWCFHTGTQWMMGGFHIYIFIVTLSLKVAGWSLLISLELALTIITFLYLRACLMSPSGFFSLSRWFESFCHQKAARKSNVQRWRDQIWQEQLREPEAQNLLCRFYRKQMI